MGFATIVKTQIFGYNDLYSVIYENYKGKTCALCSFMFTLASKGTMIKTVLIISGSLFILIGIIGLLVPIMPTVPFLIVGMILIGKGSRKVRIYIMRNKYYKKYLKKYKIMKTTKKNKPNKKNKKDSKTAHKK